MREPRLMALCAVTGGEERWMRQVVLFNHQIKELLYIIELICGLNVEGKMSQRLSLRQSQTYMLPSKLVVKLFLTKFDSNLR